MDTTKPLLGDFWKQCVIKSTEATRTASTAAQQLAAQTKADGIINNLQQNIASNIEKATFESVFLMEPDSKEVVGELKMLRGKITSSDRFLGAALIVYQYCKANKLDVWAYEEDFTMSLGSLGCRLYVVPEGMEPEPKSR